MTVTPEAVRRLAVSKQHLSNEISKKPEAKDILDVVRDLGYLQFDPISVIAPSHLLVLWSRLGSYDKSVFDNLLYKDRMLFEYWAHQASIVLTEDYPLYYPMMRGVPDMIPRWFGRTWFLRTEEWMKKNKHLHDHIMKELKERGPLFSRQFENTPRRKRKHSGWSSRGGTSRMLSHLFFRGLLSITGRNGNQKLWDISENYLPDWVSRKDMSAEEVEYEAVQRSLLALGVASASEIRFYFLRDRYPNLKGTLERLLRERKIYPVKVAGAEQKKEPRYIHSNDMESLENLESGQWHPRTTLLSPFDNLICDRRRTAYVFGFDFKFEAYVPRHKRKFGAYVLPILHGDKLIGRVDPLMDRKNEKLYVNAVHAETGAPRDKETSQEIGRAIEQLSEFLGAKEVVYSARVPDFWKRSFR